MRGNRIAHTLLHRARIASVSSSLSSVGAPSSIVCGSEATSSQSACSSSSRRNYTFAFSPAATLRLFNTNSSKDFQDEVKEHNPPQCTDAFSYSYAIRQFSYFDASIEITVCNMIN